MPAQGVRVSATTAREARQSVRDPVTGQGNQELLCCGPDLCCVGGADCSKEPRRDSPARVAFADAGSVCDPQSQTSIEPLADGTSCTPGAFVPRCTYPAVCISSSGGDAGTGVCTQPNIRTACQ